MSHHSGEEESPAQLIEMRIQAMEGKMDMMMESITSLLQGKLVGIGAGESGGARDGASVGGGAADGAAEGASSPGNGGRDATPGNPPMVRGGGPEATGPRMGLQDSGGARGFDPRGEFAAGGFGGGLDGGLGGGLDSGLGGGLGGGPGSGATMQGLPFGRDPLSLRITPPQFKGGKTEYPAFREDFIQAAKFADLFDQFVGSSARPVPVGDTGKSRAVLLADGFSVEEISASFRAWQFLSTALTQSADRNILRRSSSPKDALANLDAWYDPQTQGATQDYFNRFNEFRVASRDNPIEKLCFLENLATRLREKSIAIDERFVYARFLSALPPEYKHARLTLQATEDVRRSDLIRVVGAQYSYLTEISDDQQKAQYALVGGEASGSGTSGAGGRGKGRNRGRKNGGGNQGGDSASTSSGSTSGESTGSDTRRCHRCNRVGHIKPNCNTPESDFVPRCKKCTGYGHTPRECPSAEEQASLAFVAEMDDAAVDAEAY